MTTFTIVVLYNHVWKGSQMLPAHVALPMHLPGIFYTGVKVRIPLAICNQKYDNCNLAAEVRTLGRIVTFSSFWFCYKHPNLSIDLSHKHKNDLCIPAPRYLLAGSPKNMNQPLELQLGLLGPANSAHPRSQSNRICTLPGLYTYIYIYIYSPYTLQPPPRQEFQPASQLSPIVTTTFTIVVLSHHVWKKVPRCSLHMFCCQCIFQWFSTLRWKSRYLLQFATKNIISAIWLN